MLTDFRVALRVFSRRPAYALVATITLAAGIGATATVASVIEAVALRSLPYPDTGRLVMIWSRWTAFDKTWLSELELFDYQQESRTLSSVGAWADTAVNLTGAGDPERVSAARVTAELLPTLGTAPLLGRMFSADEDRPGHDRVVILGHALWARRYAADPAIVGRVIQVNGIGHTVVGVMPPRFVLPLDFTDPEPTQVLLPLAIDRAESERGSHYLYAVGRLGAGETVERARADIASIAARKVDAGEYPREMRFEAFAVGVEDEIVGPVRPSLVLLGIGVGLLVLIACANVASLFLVQAEGRQREMGIRAAVGAGTRELVRQLLAESFLLSAAGAVLGVGLALGAVRLIAAWPSSSVPRLSEVTVDWMVVLTVTAVTGLTAVLVGFLPAAQSVRLDVTQALRDGGHGSPGLPRRPYQNLLVVGQVAVAVVLVTAAVLILRSLAALERIDPGLRPEGVLTLRISLPEASYPDARAVTSLYDRLLERVRGLPGVTAAGAVRSLPLADPIGDWGLVIDGGAAAARMGAKGDWQVATDGAFEALGERLVRGRWFTDGDRADTALVAVVNQTMSEIHWPGRNPIGQRFRVGQSPERPWVTVVGIVGNVRHDGITAAVKEKFYVPLSQWTRVSTNVARSMALTVRTTGDPLALVDPIRREVRALDPGLPLSRVRTMADVVAATTATTRFAGTVLGAFALLAALLAAVGLYAVLSYVVTRRSRDIGLRMALGAAPAEIHRMMLRQGLTWGGAGIAVGLPASAIVVRALRGMVYGVAPTDPVTFVVVLVTLLSTTLAAAVVPARRAMRVDPMACLKEG